MKQKRIEDYGIQIGKLKKGKLNKITDVKGLKVGHHTIDTKDNKTGVTVLLPTEKNIFTHNFIAASHIINGFGKTAGLVQIDELGTLESIIGFTNTLNLGLVHDGIVDYTISRCEDESVEIESFNPIVCECNDSYLNDIKNRVVKKEHVYKAIENAKVDFEEGDIGAGKGMSCYELKGGIGSASRVIHIDGKEYILGGMVLSNFGEIEDLIIDGENIGPKIKEKVNPVKRESEGSIIIILATDIPLSSRQLKRLCKRADLGLAKTGSYVSNGSGDIAIGFSTANIINNKSDNSFENIKTIRDDKMNDLFKAVVEIVEESVLNSMITADTVVGYKNNKRHSLKEFI